MRALFLLFVLPALADTAFGTCPDVDFRAFDTAPAMVDSLSPIVDRELVASGLEGRFSVDVFVLADGTVCDVRPHGESVLERIRSVLVSEARKRRFLPATRAGQPVPGVARVTFELELRVIRNALPVPDTDPPMISERAEIMEFGATAECGDRVPAFSYQGVMFYGDLSIRDYELLRELVAEHLDGDHYVGRVDHYLVYPIKCHPGPVFVGDRPDVGVQVWRRAEGRSGNPAVTFYFVNDGGDYTPFPVASARAPGGSTVDAEGSGNDE